MIVKIKDMMNVYHVSLVNEINTLINNSKNVNKKPCYRKDDRAMHPIAYGCSEKICESLATPTANFPDNFNGLVPIDPQEKLRIWVRG